MTRKILTIALMLLVCLAAGCSLRVDFGSPTPTLQPTLPAPSAIPATLPPTAPPIPTALPPTATAQPQGASSVLIYLIAIGDKGRSGELIGCDDSAVPVSVAIEPTLGVLRAAYSQLFNLRGKREYGMSGLVNALYASDLSISSLAVENGVAHVALAGSFSLGGVCDMPRVEAQLRLTALQFNTVREVQITLNGKPLKEALSLK